MYLFKSKKRVVFLGIGLLILGVVLYFIFGPKNIPEDKIYTVKKTTLEDTISFSGEINATEKAKLQFQTSGKLVWIGVKEGDAVVAGQVVAQLDRALLQKQMQKYLNTFSKVRNDFDQDKVDYGDKVSEEAAPTGDEFKRIFGNAQMDLNNAVLDVELQNISMQYAALTTPIDGIVTRVEFPNAGVNITAASTAIEVINPATVYFAADIDQTDLPNIHESMVGKITLDAYPEKSLDGSVWNISFTPKAGETGTIYEAKIVMNNVDVSKFRMGMTGDVTFTLGKRENVLVIPLRFMRTEGDKYYVFKKNGNSSEKTYIEIGEEFNGDIEVTKGLSEKDIIYEQQ